MLHHAILNVTRHVDSGPNAWIAIYGIDYRRWPLRIQIFEPHTYSLFFFLFALRRPVPQRHTLPTTTSEEIHPQPLETYHHHYAPLPHLHTGVNPLLHHLPPTGNPVCRAPIMATDLQELHTRP